MAKQELDLAEVAQILGVVEKVTTVAPTMNYILSEGMARLHKINEGLRVAAQERAGQELTPDPASAVAANASPAAAESDQIAPDANPSQPITSPKSKIAGEADKAPDSPSTIDSSRRV